MAAICAREWVGYAFSGRVKASVIRGLAGRCAAACVLLVSPLSHADDITVNGRTSCATGTFGESCCKNFCERSRPRISSYTFVENVETFCLWRTLWTSFAKASAKVSFESPIGSFSVSSLSRATAWPQPGRFQVNLREVLPRRTRSKHLWHECRNHFEFRVGHVIGTALISSSSSCKKSSPKKNFSPPSNVATAARSCTYKTLGWPASRTLFSKRA